MRDHLVAQGLEIVAASLEILTRPVGVRGQGDFHNQVLRVASAVPRDATGWLSICKATERAAGRRETFHWGPRRADCDLLLLGEHGEICHAGDPAVPHPEILCRPYLGRLLNELDPQREATTAPATTAERPAMSDQYTHGHQESVLRSHTWRTAQNSASYLLGLLKPGQDLLDVGCGPGTITIDLGDYVNPGTVVGVDREAGVLVQADELRRRNQAANVRFTAGDAYHLDFGDATFDVVHAHQLLQHLTDPVAALREMRRVLRPGGVLAVRDGDYGAFTWAPDDRRLDRWLELYHQVTERNGAEANAGRYLRGWVQAAGFSEVQVGGSTWTFADSQSTAWWGGLWADRIRLSSFADQAVEYGLSNTEELGALSAAWQQWSTQPAAYFCALHGEVIARR